MKVALCISGQMRTYDNPHVIDGLKKFILDPLSPDVFVHTWSKKGHSLYSQRAGLDISFSDGDLNANELSSFFSSKACAVENYAEWQSNLPPVLRDAMASSHGTSIPYFYKIAACHKMRQEYGHYDVVIHCRPDVLFFKHIPEYCFADLGSVWHVNSIGIYYPSRLYDPFVVGNEANMNIFASIFDHQQTYWAIPDNSGLTPLDSCRVSYMHLRMNGVSIRSFLDRTLLEIYRQELDLQNSYFESDQEYLREINIIREMTIHGTDPDAVKRFGFVTHWLYESGFLIEKEDGLVYWR